MPYPRDEFPAELRQYKCDGTHGLLHTRVLHHTEPDGSLVEVAVEHCADATCATFTRATCLHVHNEWHYTPNHNPNSTEPENENTSALLCSFCGKDGT